MQQQSLVEAQYPQERQKRKPGKGWRSGCYLSRHLSWALKAGAHSAELQQLWWAPLQETAAAALLTSHRAQVLASPATDLNLKLAFAWSSTLTVQTLKTEVRVSRHAA